MLHQPSDPVKYNPNKHYWMKFEKSESPPKLTPKFNYKKVPFMNTGKHLPRYTQQQELIDIYLKHPKQDLVNNVIAYMKKYGEL